jgi:hypothetical protein
MGALAEVGEGLEVCGDMLVGARRALVGAGAVVGFLSLTELVTFFD